MRTDLPGLGIQAGALFRILLAGRLRVFPEVRVDGMQRRPRRRGFAHGHHVALHAQHHRGRLRSSVLHGVGEGMTLGTGCAESPARGRIQAFGGCLVQGYLGMFLQIREERRLLSCGQGLDAHMSWSLSMRSRAAMRATTAGHPAAVCSPGPGRPWHWVQ